MPTTERKKRAAAPAADRLKPPAKGAKKPAPKATTGAKESKRASPAAANQPAPAKVNGTSTETAGAIPAADDVWNLRLYVAGQTPKSIAAFANLRQLCEEHLPGRYNIEVIDLVENPHLAQGDQILALPTLVRKLPSPLKRIIGNLSDKEKFLVGMDLKPKA